ncbi:Ras-related protein Rab-7a [Mycena venus]|uniref:Ras-related protein Rab-7a n=1 Tax=Mycena venus TaxID=2733690 RepID=A0A8H7DDW1_9AGAR|nr:Ras-related protein Rab-7a [Mycena venus]
MPTFKVVVIGASGVGKTSLRGQYISARFSTSYRATIGADFITKTLPAPTPAAEPITLQIWDTAGQERFSSLASAFFRGADAAVLMYDVTAPETLFALSKWWAEFKDKAPVREEELRHFCVVVVGNKTDLARDLLGRWCRGRIRPPPSPGPSRLTLAADDDDDDERASDSDGDADDALASSELTARPGPRPHPLPTHRKTHSSQSQVAFSHPPSPSPLLAAAGRHKSSSSRASSHSRYGAGASTATSTLTIYHTPSSSVFSDGASEYYHSAQSSYHTSYDPGVHLQAEAGSGRNGNGNGDGKEDADSPSARSVSEATITPARFASSTDDLNGHSRESSASTVAATSTTSSDPAPSSPTSNATSPSPTSPASPEPISPSTNSTSSNPNCKSRPPPPARHPFLPIQPSPLGFSFGFGAPHFPLGAQSLAFAFGAQGQWNAKDIGIANPNQTAQEERNGGWGKHARAAGGGGGALEFGMRGVAQAQAQAQAQARVQNQVGANPSANGVNSQTHSTSTSLSLSHSTSTSHSTSAPLSHGSTPSTTADGPTYLTEPDLPYSNVGAAHFRVSARTGEGVNDVFAWVARRLVRRAGEMGFEEGGDDGRKGGNGGAEERLRLNAGFGEQKGKGGCC